MTPDPVEKLGSGTNYVWSNMQYRDLARRHLKIARAELSSGQDERVTFAALELRMAIEALTYARARAYKEELPPQEYETWQPKKLMAVLLEIDPNIDKNSAIAVGVETEYGVKPDEMKWLGEESVLNMKTIKTHYDALGSFLHVPTLKSITEGKVANVEKLRKRCEQISLEVEKSLASTVFNSTLGNFSSIQCLECESVIRKRIPFKAVTVEAACFSCSAAYTLHVEDAGKIRWEPQIARVPCSDTDCDAVVELWRYEFQPGQSWTCDKCDRKNVLRLCVTELEGV